MKKVNINAWMWFFVLIVYCVFMIHLIVSNRILLFIHPKMIKYIAFTIIVFIILISRQIIQLNNIKNSSNKLDLSFLIFMLPVILTVIVNPNQLNAKTAVNKGINIPSVSQQLEVPDETEKSEELVQPIQVEVGYNTQEGKDFLDVIEGISNDFENVLGTKVEISGFIFLQEDFNEGQFVISRYMMNCCAADVQLIGVLCKYSDDYPLVANEWIKISGIVDQIMYKGSSDEEEIEMAQIIVSEVEGIIIPDDQYVYPY
ncbi:MAG: TIGR03943 family protein [Firmicutes bacterium HGW-Firmicutes-7]|nr:MAG: TIGR03943 family protein [Firmicutes bacterium HGW-Firmicutes-7]